MNSDRKRLMRWFDYSLWVIGLNLSLAAYGGQEGNGGNVLFCDPSSGRPEFQLADYWAAESWGLKIDTPKGLDYRAILSGLIERLEDKAPARAAQLKIYWNEFENPVNRLDTDKKLGIPKPYFLEVPDGCELKRVITQNVAWAKEKYVRNMELWNRLDAKTRAGLVFHEISYREGIEYREESAVPIIKLTALVSSKGFKEMIPRDIFSFIDLDHANYWHTTYFEDWGRVFSEVTEFYPKGLGGRVKKARVKGKLWIYEFSVDGEVLRKFYTRVSIKEIERVFDRLVEAKPGSTEAKAIDPYTDKIQILEHLYQIPYESDFKRHKFEIEGLTEWAIDNLQVLVDSSQTREEHDTYQVRLLEMKDLESRFKLVQEDFDNGMMRTLAEKGITEDMIPYTLEQMKPRSFLGQEDFEEIYAKSVELWPFVLENIQKAKDQDLMAFLEDFVKEARDRYREEVNSTKRSKAIEGTYKAVANHKHFKDATLEIAPDFIASGWEFMESSIEEYRDMGTITLVFRAVKNDGSGAYTTWMTLLPEEDGYKIDRYWGMIR